MNNINTKEKKDIVLSVHNLATHFFIKGKISKVLDGVDFYLEKGETLALMGESGSGKTVSALSILKLITPPGKIVSGEVIFNGKDILKMNQSQIRKIRGKGIALISQEPMSSLNPSMTIGRQIMEAIEINQGFKGKEARNKVLEILQLVRIPSPENMINSYPYEFSGGMKQRVMIAIGLSCQPQILFADEPTASLDVTIQAQILELMKLLKKEIGTTIFLIANNLGVVAEMADRVVIIYAGQVVEVGNVFEIFHKPAHPYTSGIVKTVMELKSKNKRLEVIKGQPPSLINPPDGCRFHPRCRFAKDICCKEKPAYKMIKGSTGRWVRCYFPLE